MIKSVLVREIVNSDVGESRELANLRGGFRDCSTNNLITCTRIEANIEKIPSKKRKQSKSDFLVNYRLFQPLIPYSYFLIATPTSGLMLKTWQQLYRKTVEKDKALKNLKALSNALQFFVKWERLNLIMYKKRGITTSNSIGQRYIFVLA